MNKLDHLRIKIADLLSSKDLNMTLKSSKSKESLLHDSFYSSGTYIDNKDISNYGADAKSSANYNSLNRRFNTFIDNKDSLNYSTYDAHGKQWEQNYEDPYKMNTDYEDFFKPLKSHIDEGAEANKIKTLESEIIRLKSFEQQVVRQNFTIKTLKGMISKSKKQPSIDAFGLNDLTEWLALQAKVIEELSQSQ